MNQAYNIIIIIIKTLILTLIYVEAMFHSKMGME